MKAAMVEQVYSELRARDLIKKPIFPPDFQVIAETLSVGEPMSIAEAIEKIRSVESLRDRYRTIDMEIAIHESSVEIVFGVWAGGKEYKGATIENAVTSCLVANKELSGTPEEAGRVVREAMEYQGAKTPANTALLEAANKVVDWYEGRVHNGPEERTAMYQAAKAAIAEKDQPSMRDETEGTVTI